MRKNKKILIIGGSGFIGTHLINKSIKLGWNVTSLSLKKRKKNQISKKINYIYADFTNFNLLKKKVKFDFDYIVNLGGYIDHRENPSQSLKIIKNHYQSTINLIALNKRKLKRYIHIGTSDEYGENKSPIQESFKEDPKSTYSLAKNMSINLLLMLHKEYNFPVTILRFFLVYGPHQKRDRLIPYVISNSLKDTIIYLSHGKQLRDFCYVEDAIEAIILCLKNKKSLGEIFNVGYGSPISVKQMVKKIIMIVGKRKPKFN